MTVQIINPEKPDEPKQHVLPLLDSSPKCPCFGYRCTIEKSQQSALAMLRVYSVDKVTDELVCIGWVTVPIYIEETQDVVSGLKKIERLFRYLTHHIVAEMV